MGRVVKPPRVERFLQRIAAGYYSLEILEVCE
jgi:hypothetical protein